MNEPRSRLRQYLHEIDCAVSKLDEAAAMDAVRRLAKEAYLAGAYAVFLSSNILDVEFDSIQKNLEARGVDDDLKPVR